MEGILQKSQTVFSIIPVSDSKGPWSLNLFIPQQKVKALRTLSKLMEAKKSPILVAIYCEQFVMTSWNTPKLDTDIYQ